MKNTKGTRDDDNASTYTVAIDDVSPSVTQDDFVKTVMQRVRHKCSGMGETIDFMLTLWRTYLNINGENT